MDRDVLVADVDHEQRVGQGLHQPDAAEAALQLDHLAAQLGRLLLAALVERAGGGHVLQLAEALDRRPDGLEIREHSAEPALVHVRHLGPQRLLLDRVARRALGADEQHRAAVGDDLPDELRGVREQRLRLLEIDDVDLVAFTEDEGFHLRVPEAGLMSKMDTRFQHLSHGHAGHGEFLSIGLWPPRIPADDPASGPPVLKLPELGTGTPLSRTPGHRFVMRVWIALPKKAALYTMKFQPEQCFKQACGYLCCATPRSH